MDPLTNLVSSYIKEKGIQTSTVSEATKIPCGILYPCFSGKRALRATEFLKICNFLEIEPTKFWNKIEKEAG